MGSIFTSRCCLSFGNDLQSTEDANGGLGGEEDGVVRLTETAVEDALQEAAAVPQGDEHEGLALATKSVDPAENLKMFKRDILLKKRCLVISST